MGLARAQWGYNASMRRRWIFQSLILVGAVLLGACAQEPSAEAPMAASGTLDGTLRPYPSGTATATPYPTGYVSPTPSPTATPSPTPVYYEVMLGDDMYSIAWRFDVSPEAIMTANPTVNPRAMTVGTLLLIPITPAPAITPTPTVQGSPTATPPYAGMAEPVCYPDAVGGLWCFVLVENDAAGALENVSGVVRLTPSGDGEVRSEAAIMPLNLLPAGEALPLVAYFQPPLPGDYAVSAEVEFLLPVMPEDARYLSLEIQEQGLSLSPDGRIATLRGVVALAEGQPDAETLWLAATALDGTGQVVAVRRWEAQNQLAAGESLAFELTVYSLGGAIERVDVLGEAQAAGE